MWDVQDLIQCPHRVWKDCVLTGLTGVSGLDVVNHVEVETHHDTGTASMERQEKENV